MEGNSMNTKTNTSSDVDARDFKGRFFALATYALKANAIHESKKAIVKWVSTLTDAELDAALLENKTAIRRLQDPETVMVSAMKTRIENGSVFSHFYVDTWERQGAIDWTEIGKATNMTKEAARVRFAGTVKVEALKPRT